MVSHRRAARRVGPPSIAQCGAAAARGCRRWAVRGRSESILSKLQYTSGTGNQGHFWPWQESCASCCAGCSVPLVLFRAIVLLTSRVHECDYMYCGAGKYILHCTGWCSSRPARTEPGLEPFAFRAVAARARRRQRRCHYGGEGKPILTREGIVLCRLLSGLC